MPTLRLARIGVSHNAYLGILETKHNIATFTERLVVCTIFGVFAKLARIATGRIHFLAKTF
jgi:hypothetical protein